MKVQLSLQISCYFNSNSWHFIVEVLTLLRKGAYPQFSAKLMEIVAFNTLESQAPDAQVSLQ